MKAAQAAGDGESRHERTRRLFFAAWPAASLRDAIVADYLAPVPPDAGRLQQPAQLHLTLEFLGSVPESRLPRLRDLAAALEGASCVVTLDRVAWWRRPAVLCLVASQCPPELMGLVEALRRALRGEGFQTDSRPYQAHLTLARKVGHPVVLSPPRPLSWPVQEFTLVESDTQASGSVYTVLDRWPLRG
jgi:2'-5' RNA ligase